MDNCLDLYGRQHHIDNIDIKDNDYLPYEYEKYLEKYYFLEKNP
jgi:hypothetical protein